MMLHHHIGKMDKGQTPHDNEKTENCLKFKVIYF